MAYIEPTAEQKAKAKKTMISSGIKLIISLFVLYLVYEFFKAK